MNMQKATELFEQAVEHKRRGNYQASLSAYLQAERVLDNEPEFYKALGKLYYILGQYQKAIECYVKVIRLTRDLDIVILKHMGQAICDPAAVNAKQKALAENYRRSIDPYFSQNGVKKYESVSLNRTEIADYERYCINTAAAQFE